MIALLYVHMIRVIDEGIRVFSEYGISWLEMIELNNCYWNNGMRCG